MLGFSFSKILFTIVMILAVWWVYKQINRIGDESGRSKVGSTGKSRGAKSGKSGETSAPDPDHMQTVEDLTACPSCGAYVAAGSNPGCGRPAKDCPMNR